MTTKIRESYLILSVIFLLICHPFSKATIIYYLFILILIGFYEEKTTRKINVVGCVRSENVLSQNTPQISITWFLVAILTQNQFQFHSLTFIWVNQKYFNFFMKRSHQNLLHVAI